MSKYKFRIKDIDLSVARGINKELALEGLFLPVQIIEDTLVVIGVENNESIMEYLSFIYDKKIKFIIIDHKLVTETINGVFCMKIGELHKNIIENAILQNASDIHFEPIMNEVLIRYRVDGMLKLERKINHIEYTTLLSKIKLKSGGDITELRRPQDGKYNFKVENETYDLRVSTIPTVYGEKLVIRILYGRNFDLSIDKMNLTENQREKLMRIISMRNGLVIINGPTGSGKSTTLYTILQNINNEFINITTLEDPIEVIISGVNQINLNKKADITFSTGLRSILRQDPDVIMLGEIRDEETASMAVKAALTGHKVYATIHTKTPREVFLRLDDMGVKQYLLKDSIVGIVSQRLIRTLCNECKLPIEDVYVHNKKVKAYVKSKCLSCNNTGYKGRAMVAAIEMIHSGNKRVVENIYQEIDLLSNVKMIDSLIALLEKGSISIQDYKDFILEEGINEKLYKTSTEKAK